MSELLARLRRHAERRAQAPALDDGRAALSYGALLRRVGAVAQATARLPQVVGLLAGHGLDWALGELAIEAAGRTFVPLPDFFSDAQLRHILADAKVEAALAAPDCAARAASLGLPLAPIPPGEAVWEATPRSDAARIVYTSGSTGAPKGVRLGARQLEASCRGLALAVDARADDLHLSALPYALLLESLCGLRLPLTLGARVRILAEASGAPPTQVPALLARAAWAAAPTTTVLTPQLLVGWVAALEAGVCAAPPSLRFVAVGGAATPEPLLARAKALGLPAYQGYGLTECGSVVAVNRPGADRPGTCGRPLSGVEIAIAADGEIVVRSPSLMDGYLGSAGAPPAAWPTGDLGALGADGFLVVRGRKDNLIVRPSGRNVSPEWVEAMLLAEPAIAQAALTQSADGELVAFVEPRTAPPPRLDFDRLLADAPAYARPDRFALLQPGAFRALGLLTANGRLSRAALARHVREI